MKIDTNQVYVKHLYYMVIVSIVLIGAINWGASAVGFNFVEILSNGLNSMFKSQIPFDKIIYVIVGLSGIFLAARFHTWLPFLGRTVLPGQLLELKTPENTNKVVTIQTEPNIKIVYWAALPKKNSSDPTPDVVMAYGDFSNSGVIMSDENGNASFPILVGSDYIVPSGKKIKRHIHYRELNLPYGMMGEVRTVYY